MKHGEVCSSPTPRHSSTHTHQLGPLLLHGDHGWARAEQRVLHPAQRRLLVPRQRPPVREAARARGRPEGHRADVRREAGRRPQVPLVEQVHRQRCGPGETAKKVPDHGVARRGAGHDRGPRNLHQQLATEEVGAGHQAPARRHGPHGDLAASAGKGEGERGSRRRGR